MWRKSLIAAAAIAGLIAPALAQTPQERPTSVRGSIVKLQDHSITIKTRDGALTTVQLAPDYRVNSLVRKKLSDIHAGDFVGSTAVPGADGKLHAVEVHIFPEAQRGAGEGQYPWDLRPQSLMTNATVTGIAKAPQGEVLSVNYKNGTAQVIVGPKTPIVTPVPASARDLKPGKAVYVFARRDTAGDLTARSITVEKNGVKPPM